MWGKVGVGIRREQNKRRGEIRDKHDVVVVFFLAKERNMETHLKPGPKLIHREREGGGGGGGVGGGNGLRDDSAFEESLLLFFFRGNGGQPHRDLALFLSSLSSISLFLLPPDLILHSHLHLHRIISLPP